MHWYRNCESGIHKLILLGMLSPSNAGHKTFWVRASTNASYFIWQPMKAIAVYTVGELRSGVTGFATIYATGSHRFLVQLHAENLSHKNNYSNLANKWARIYNFFISMNVMVTVISDSWIFIWQSTNLIKARGLFYRKWFCLEKLLHLFPHRQYWIWNWTDSVENKVFVSDNQHCIRSKFRF